MCFYLSYLLLGIPSQDPKGLKTRCSRTSLRRTRPRASGIGMRRWLNLAESARDSKSSQVTFGGSQMEGDQKAEDIVVVILENKKTLNKWNFWKFETLRCFNWRYIERGACSVILFCLLVIWYWAVSTADMESSSVQIAWEPIIDYFFVILFVYEKESLSKT